MSNSERERFEIPTGVWVRVGSWMVRIVENTIGGHVWEKRPAPRRARARDDRQSSPTTPPSEQETKDG